ncbi:DUF1353 domain-containing protein [Algimonas porphyrae]|uniref:DUF1353 domain-containing protein n=1 Tax=Algimonas porphyrae TaxID=1128113 RepID=A0ABQ5V2Q6_9PROT|nr:DUF1353 domain-containing protein [Algimonas porphyrae]GLQ20512.1 hypothetical protein GCM10007854_14670 [Algimonas porphyrae]
MGRFTTPLIYRRIPDCVRTGRPRFRLRESFTYALKEKDGPIAILVPKNFKTDLATIPRLIDDWFGLNPSGRLAKAAVLHDYLYGDPQALLPLIWAILNNRTRLGEDYVRTLTGPLPERVDDLRQLADDPAFQRRVADRIFREAAQVPPRSGWDGRMSRLIACLAYTAVRLFGGRAFQTSLKTKESFV